jgi:hypothetical protein
LGFNEALHLRCLPQKSSQMFDALIDALFQTQSINLRFHTASVESGTIWKLTIPFGPVGPKVRLIKVKTQLVRMGAMVLAHMLKTPEANPGISTNEHKPAPTIK